MHFSTLPPSLTTNELLSIIIAGVSLLVSVAALYFSVFAKFCPVVIPVKRVTLTNYKQQPYIMVHCEFINNGARSVFIDDLHLIVKGQGSDGDFVAALARKDIDVFVESGEHPQPLRDFSAVFLSSKKSMELYVFFNHKENTFNLVSGEYNFEFRYSYDNKKNYKKSPISFTVSFSEANIIDWKDNKIVRVDSIDLLNARKKDFKK